MKLRSVLYVSEADAALTMSDVRQLVDVARMLNRRKDLSGLLVFTGRHFLQILEGGETALASTLAAIRRDVRHSGVVELLDEALPRRNFDQWEMGLVNSPDWADRVATLKQSGSREEARQFLDELLVRARSHGAGSNSLFMD